MMKKLFCVFFFAILLFSLSCTNTRQESGVFKAYLTVNPTTLDPVNAVDVPSGVIMAKIFNGLMTHNEKAEIVCDLADTFSVSEDGRRYSFKLKQNVRFQNGRELEAGDVKYSFERILLEKSPRAWIFEKVFGAEKALNGTDKSVAGFKVIDKYTFEIELNGPFAQFLHYLAMPNAYIVAKEDVQKQGDDFSKNPSGTGPFKLIHWEQDSKMILEANESYFGGKPKTGQIEYRIIKEPVTQIAEFETGNIDYLYIPTAEFRRFISDKRWKDCIISQLQLNVFFIALNCQSFPLDRKEIRQALNYAIDRESILKSILEGRGVTANNPIPPNLPGCDFSKSIAGYKYDKEKAKQLIWRNGFKKPLVLDLLVRAGSEDAVNVAQAVQANLKDVGVEVNIKQLEWTTMKSYVNEGKFQMAYWNWFADYPDGENFIAPLFYSKNIGEQGNRARFSDKEVDRIIEDVWKEQNYSKRADLCFIASKIINEKAPWVFLWHTREYVVHQPWVKGMKLYPIFNSDKGLDIEKTK